MILWVAIALLCFALAHLYFYRAMRRSLSLGRKEGRLLALVCLLLMCSAPAVHLLGHASLTEFARLLAPLSFTWMALLFLFISLSMPLEGILFAWIHLHRRYPERVPAPGNWLRGKLPLSVAAALCLYGTFEARDIRVEHVEIHSDKIVAGSPSCTIALLADVHLGLMHGPERLRAMLAPLRSQNYDLLVLAGDTVDGPVTHSEELADIFRDVAPPLGTIAISGNHEFYAGINAAADFLKQSDITLLRNQTVQLLPHLRITGVDDQAAGGRQDTRPPPSLSTFMSPDPSIFTVLLKHRPVVLPEELPLVDLQLSGHIHQGQIFPAALLTRLFFPYPAGLTELESGKWLYVSRGTGTWGPRIRVLAPPEITLITIKPGQKSKADRH